MQYPLRTEYNTAVSNLDKFVLDNKLKTGKPVKESPGSHFLRSHSGGKAIVYEIEINTKKKYALKCWVQPLGNLENRYNKIDNYLKKINLPYFVDFSYNKEGIIVNGKRYPTVRMEWVNGISLKKFIANNINKSSHILDIAKKFLEMVKILHQHNISHGDLQHGNIMIRSDGGICLIDYDSLCVPQLVNEPDEIKGLPGYQHQQRSQLTNLSPKVDYFSELIIYLSLLAISENESYWQDIEKEERLLFSKEDLVNPRSSKIFTELKKASHEIQYFTNHLEEFCYESSIERLQPLENLVNIYPGSKKSWDFASNPSSIVAPSQTSITLNSSARNTCSSNTQVNTSLVNTIISNLLDKFDRNQPVGKNPLKIIVLILGLFIPTTILFIIFMYHMISVNNDKVPDISTLERNLQLGMEGDDVREIEHFLRDFKCNPGRVDGKFDKDTEAAVIRLQSNLSLEKDGIIGPDTIRKIRRYFKEKDGKNILNSLKFDKKASSIPTIERNLKLGMEGDDVRAIEHFLQALKYNPGRVDGKFDKNTEAAVIRLQSNLSLEKDGIIGPDTIRKIRKVSARKIEPKCGN